MMLRVHRTVERSAANGPGERFVVWLQGCTLSCPGCFNPGAWDPGGGREAPVEELAARINATPGLRGLTLSGGEPLQQPEAVAELLRLVDERLDRVLFTGYSLEEVLREPRRAAALCGVDLVVAGRYARGLAAGASPWAGSSNKEVRALTVRILPDEFPAARVEAHIAPDGKLLVTGFPPAGLMQGQ